MFYLLTFKPPLQLVHGHLKKSRLCQEHKNIVNTNFLNCCNCAVSFCHNSKYVLYDFLPVTFVMKYYVM